MITRGHLIGQIVDDLGSISAQAKQRAVLKLYDVHTYVEDFILEVLNIVYDLELRNLNSEKSNNPGIDLGDDASGRAFQVTADKSRAKIKDTLGKISEKQQQKYPKVQMLIIGEKQGSYSLNGEPFKSAGFTVDDILDFNDICAATMSLSIERVEQLAAYLSKETRRVRVELEIPDSEGRYQTNIDALVEAMPKPKLTKGKKLIKFGAKQDLHIDAEVVENSIKEISEKLTQLPRLTREVFKFLIERSDVKGMSHTIRIALPKVERLYRGSDLEGDLSLLIEAGLIDWNEPDNSGEAAYWQVNLPGWRDEFHLLFLEYVEQKGVNLNKPLVALDFSDF